MITKRWTASPRLTPGLAALVCLVGFGWLGACASVRPGTQEAGADDSAARPAAPEVVTRPESDTARTRVVAADTAVVAVSVSAETTKRHWTVDVLLPGDTTPRFVRSTLRGLRIAASELARRGDSVVVRITREPGPGAVTPVAGDVSAVIVVAADARELSRLLRAVPAAGPAVLIAAPPSSPGAPALLGEPLGTVIRWGDAAAEAREGAGALAEFAGALGLDRVAVLRSVDESAGNQAAGFGEGAARAGITVAAEASYSRSSGVAPAVAELAVAKPAALFVAAPAADMGRLLRAIRARGFEAGVQVLGAAGWAEPGALRRVPASLVEGVVATLPRQPGEPGGGSAAFVEKYRALGGGEPVGLDAARGYDLLAVLAAAAEARDASPAGIRAGLEGLRGVEGASGTLAVIGSAIVREPVLVRITDGEPITIQVGAPSYQPRD